MKIQTDFVHNPINISNSQTNVFVHTEAPAKYNQKAIANITDKHTFLSIELYDESWLR